MFIYRYDQLKPDELMTYEDMRYLCNIKNRFTHFGQLKLFFTELYFLAKCGHTADRVLYIGAASGYHITRLADMFPQLSFDLWDKGKFEVEERPNITIYNRYFTNADAGSYNSTKVLLMCDIRNIGIRKLQQHKQNTKIDELIDVDLSMQMTWCQIIKPVYAYLKFRLPYGAKSLEYFGGTIYLQPYFPLSTETRLLTNNYEDIVTYDGTEYDQHMAWFNGKIRCNEKIDTGKWTEIINQYHLLDTWDNLLALQITRYFLKKKGDSSRDAAGELFMEVVRFHLKRYPDKAYIVFQPGYEKIELS